ncbi:MAG: hypothetical protein OXE57_11330, partial [Alphaproteobacteria bacterium]|nr:hypothetical protein [Alphaproteobacteria bacterium]
MASGDDLGAVFVQRMAMAPDRLLEGRPEELRINHPAALGGTVLALRHERGYRMPRENIDRLVDPGSFQEYWPLLTALQHQRYDIETLMQKYPADGV